LPIQSTGAQGLADVVVYVDLYSAIMWNDNTGAHVFEHCLSSEEDNMLHRLKDVFLILVTGCRSANRLKFKQTSLSSSGLVTDTTSVSLEAVVHPHSLAFMRLSQVIMFDYLVWRLRRTLVWTCTFANVYKTCFFWLRQARRIRRSLDVESVKTLHGSFVCHITSRLLQLGPGVCSKECHSEVATGSERCSASDRRNPETRACLSRLLCDDLRRRSTTLPWLFIGVFWPPTIAVLGQVVHLTRRKPVSCWTWRNVAVRGRQLLSGIYRVAQKWHHFWLP